ncbi:uncharacterized protein Dmoj_GI26568 [Drosophila mojavensis]|uniref:Uncharacterized protein n=1 Tax=Drosophila mojavensis TaxID=7230 RepID=A0A0Q9XBG8_DROMO|nr:uncharacterized protein Dmoj_GI26568 [Drosophila mojavensis]
MWWSGEATDTGKSPSCLSRGQQQQQQEQEQQEQQQEQQRQ